MSELKCNCGRATHTGLGCGPDLPRTPYDRQAELATLRAENARLRAALERNLQGYRNLLEVRRIAYNRYGALTREEIEQEIGLVEAALAGKEQGNG